MTTVTVSPKFQVVIPKKIREKFAIEVGQKFQIIPYENRLEFIPVVDIRSMRGFLKGIDTSVNREEDRL